jgi:hypothetical protein
MMDTSNADDRQWARWHVELFDRGYCRHDPVALRQGAALWRTWAETSVTLRGACIQQAVQYAERADQLEAGAPIDASPGITGVAFDDETEEVLL